MKWRVTTAAILIAALGAALRGSDADIWKDAGNLRLLGIERVARSDFREGIPVLQTAADLDPKPEAAIAALANVFHLQRRLDEAAVQYSRLLRLKPAALPTREQEDAILRFAPRVFQASSDPFPLKDVVAIHHPREPLIAYHFFWEDDIDFPEDNDPCDHELVWVRYDPATRAVVTLDTYFHGRLLRSEAAVQEAHRQQERVRVNVQWGKHGSLPFGWEQLRIQANPGDVEREYLDLTKPVTLQEYNRATWLKLQKDGRRMMDHPLSREWPRRFDGTWNDFIAFNKEVDIRPVLRKRKTMATSEWNNAVLQQQFLSYNFRPKTEWPGPSEGDAGLKLRRSVAPVSDPLLTALEAPATLPPDLPPASLFKPETPRYPNIWFYSPEPQFPSYAKFVEWLDSRFRAAGYSPDAVSLNEGADIALSIEHLQPWNSLSRLSHSHAVHIRFFWKRLQNAGMERVRFGRGDVSHWRVAASVHYEVDHFSPLHADVELCPFCGRTGGYADKEGHLVERVHDPLGVELLLWGTVKGKQVQPPMIERFLDSTTEDWIVSGPKRADMNTEAIALVTVRP